jgi:hypothetical protein
MKRNIMLVALFIAAFMFPSIGSVDTADALGNYGCNTPQTDRNRHVTCLRTLLSQNGAGHLSSPSDDGLGNFGCSAPTRSAHVNCLRALLDTHAPHVLGGTPGAPTFDDALMGSTPGYEAPPVGDTAGTQVGDPGYEAPQVGGP